MSGKPKSKKRRVERTFHDQRKRERKRKRKRGKEGKKEAEGRFERWRKRDILSVTQQERQVLPIGVGCENFQEALLSYRVSILLAKNDAFKRNFKTGSERE